MVIMNGWKIVFGQFIGSTYAYNRLAEVFTEEFNKTLGYDDKGNLFYVIENEEEDSENVMRNMYYFIKGYCKAHKAIHFHSSHLFQ